MTVAQTLRLEPCGLLVGNWKSSALDEGQVTARTVLDAAKMKFI